MRAAHQTQLSKGVGTSAARRRRSEPTPQNNAADHGARGARARRGKPALREPAPRVRQLGAPGRVRQESWLYGEELRGSVRRRLYQSQRLLRLRIDLYGDEMTDHDRDTFANNLRINQHQPPTVPQFTELGHKLVRIPDPLRSRLFQHRQLMLDRDLLRREGCTRGYLNNCGRHPTLTMPLDRDLTREINRATADVLEEWIGREKWGHLVHTSTYGIRRYTNGSTLQAHVDVVATHAVSAILNVGQDVDSDWPLQIMGHDGQAHSVVMAPGDMVLYESAKAIHARMIPLNGTSYDNVFVHFRPSKGWRGHRRAERRRRRGP